MNRIEKLLPDALNAVEYKKVLNENGEVPKEFNGHISSFGSSIINSGILPTLVFFSQEGKTGGDRTSIVNALEYIMKKDDKSLLANSSLILKVKECITNNDVKTLNRIEEKIMEAAIALKLAIRIYPKAK